MPSPLRRPLAAPVGAVLAGGAGRRLGGGGKAAVELIGRPLACHAVDVLLAAGIGDVAVVAKAGTELPALPPGVARWEEPDEPRHPLAGLVHALRRASGRPVVALACDLPLVPSELVRRVAEEPPRGTRATVARGQPLCGRYEPTALAPLEAALLGPLAPRLTDVVAALRPREVEPLGLDDLHNVNTPEDLLAAAALLDRRGAPRRRPLDPVHRSTTPAPTSRARGCAARGMSASSLRRRRSRSRAAASRFGTITAHGEDGGERRVQVRVRLGGGLARLARAPMLTLEVSDGATVGELYERLRATEPALAPALGSAVPVLAGEHVSRDRRLADRDQVALLLPISGG